MIYLTESEITKINYTLMVQYQGIYGIQYPQGLSVIINQPKQGYENTQFYPTIWDKAAYIIQRLADMHIFIDGNKRTAYIATKLFLRKNGYALIGTTQYKLNLMLKITTMQNNPNWIINELKSHSKKI